MSHEEEHCSKFCMGCGVDRLIVVGNRTSLRSVSVLMTSRCIGAVGVGQILGKPANLEKPRGCLHCSLGNLGLECAVRIPGNRGSSLRAQQKSRKHLR